MSRAIGQAKEMLMLIRSNKQTDIKEKLVSNLNKSCDAIGIPKTVTRDSNTQEMEDVIKQLEIQRDRQQSITKKEQIKKWKDKMNRNSKHVYKWLKDQSPTLPCILPDDKGRPTSDPI